MNAVLICPDNREAAGFARRMKPLALLPIMGRELLDLWLEKLAGDGVKQVTLLAADRPDQIRRAIGNGGRWGLKINVIPVASEPSIEDARSLFATDPSTRVLKLDTLPALPKMPLWESTEGLFDVMMKKFGHAEAESHLTMRRISSDMYISTRARIAPTAIIEGPVWIGPQVIIGPGAHIMPGTIIESAAYIDRQATVRGSWIGPKTYVGAMTEVSHSFAWGSGLENWRLGSFIEVTDDFLLASLKKQPFGGARSSWFTRLLALLIMLLSAPLALLCMAWSRLIRQRSAFSRAQVIVPPPGMQDRYTRTVGLHTLTGHIGLFARWPQLWLVWRGDMHLVGNRPLTPAAASLLGDEFEQLWLATPAGVFSLADAANDGLDDAESSLAHAAYYSVNRSFRLNVSILLRCLPRFLSLRQSFNTHVFIHPSTATTTAHA
jgi:hypothetical protein